MHLTRIAATDFRLFERFEFEPGPRLNYILGANASGKTSVLEAIHSVGRGRGFRGKGEELLRHGATEWVVHAVAAGEGALGAAGVAWSDQGGLRLRVDRNEVALPELARRLPVQALEPDSHRLLEDGPAYRRRYLDWGVFHVEHPFFEAWRRYQRALKQRNQALRQGLERAAVEAWNGELTSAGGEVTSHRESHVAALRAGAANEIERLIGEPGWILELATGWPQQQSLGAALVAHYEQDRRQGKTSTGPHRAELRLRRDGRSSRRHSSRGQQKLLVAALLLSQARLIAAACGSAPILLVDDFPAELGPGFQAAFLAALGDYPGQVFLSAIEPSAAMLAVKETPVFHVEHGSVRPLKQV